MATTPRCSNLLSIDTTLRILLTATLVLGCFPASVAQMSQQQLDSLIAHMGQYGGTFSRAPLYLGQPS
jgi:hypothetical protein